jgi:hypothetical protein
LSEQFFSVQHALTISATPMSQDFELPDFTTFEREIPETFKISDVVAQLDSSNARSIRQMSDDLSYLVEVINQQSKKINLLMAHILLQEDTPDSRSHTYSYGGSHLSYLHANPVADRTLVRLKIFLYEEASAVYCYGRVTHSEPWHDDNYLIHIEYELIREPDRELLIRASIHEQSRQLKVRAEKKYQPT